MSVIPVTFKADGGDSSKKGKIRAEDLSVLNAFCLPKKTGILNVLNKCDAYNLTPSSPDTFFYLHSGYVVICGRLVYIEEATQCSIALPVSGTETGYFGIKIDLSATEGDECKLFQKTGTLIQNDLNENPVSGVYEFPIFRYTATSSTVTALDKIGDIINSNVPFLSNASIYTAGRDGTVDSTKTIDEKLNDFSARLTTLGFKSGDSSVRAFSGVTITEKSLSRIGNYVIGHIKATVTNHTYVTAILSFGANFAPKSNVTGLYGLRGNNFTAAREIMFYSETGSVAVKPASGEISSSTFSGDIDIVFGYEANDWVD